jgi:LysM repeat protein
MISPACRRLLPGLLVAFCLAGCIPTRDAGAEEEREPHFQRGRELARMKDYRGAAEAFERAVEANPRSASAHFELGLLGETQINDPAAAIYHYERFLRLRPTSDKADVARQRVNNCKLELAKHFLLTSNAPSVQKEMDKLRTEIERLGLENNQLKRQFESLATTGSPAPKTIPAPPQSVLVPIPAKVAEPPAPAAKAPAPAAPTRRTHAVKAGETPEIIARRNGVKLEALLAANPGLDPKRLKIGQTLNLPTP